MTERYKLHNKSDAEVQRMCDNGELVIEYAVSADVEIRSNFDCCTPTCTRNCFADAMRERLLKAISMAISNEVNAFKQDMRKSGFRVEALGPEEAVETFRQRMNNNSFEGPDGEPVNLDEEQAAGIIEVDKETGALTVLKGDLEEAPDDVKQVVMAIAGALTRGKNSRH